MINSISEGSPDRADASPSMQARDALRREILEAAILLEAGRAADARATSTLLSRAELRAAAVRDTTPVDGEFPPLRLGTEVTRQWVEQDLAVYIDIRLPDKRDAALSEIAANARHSAEYSAALRERSMPLATAVAALNFALDKEELERQSEVARVRRLDQSPVQQAATLAAVDAEAVARVEALRQQQAEAAQNALNAGRSTDIKPVDEPAHRTVRRRIDIDEVPADLRARYDATIVDAGLLNRGRTEFTPRGALDGRVAFTDLGRQLVAQDDDRATVRALIAIAQVKGWKQITVDGTDEFRRAAGLEGRLQGLEVRGWTPREADRPPPLQGQQIDLERLTERESRTLEGLVAVLRTKGFEPAFVGATTQELEARLRSQRVYAGELIAHGRAPHMHDPQQPPSDYVTLKTGDGLQTLWGQGLAAAIAQARVRPGDAITLGSAGLQGDAREAWVARPLTQHLDGAAPRHLEPSLAPARSEPTRAAPPRAFERD